jgi:hypothetical protein
MPVFNKDISRVKMYVLRSGKHKPITWYSIIDKDGKDLEIICKNMLGRFNNYLEKNPTIRPTINVINFYEKGFLIGTATL